MSTKTIDGVLTVFVVGDVDLAHADELQTEVSSLMAPQSTVVLDCSGVTFLDSMGLHALVRLAAYADDVGARFRLGKVSPAVQKVIDLAGVGGLLAD